MIIRLLCLVLITHISLAQDLEETHQILAEKVNAINKFRDHEVVKMQGDDVNPEYNGLVWLRGFYKDGVVQKMTLIMENDLGVVAFNYYLDNGQLIYISETYDQFLSADKIKSNRTFNGKYFFNDGKMFDREAKGNNRFDDPSLNPETILLSEMNKNLDLLSKYRNNPVGMRK